MRCEEEAGRRQKPGGMETEASVSRRTRCMQDVDAEVNMRVKGVVNLKHGTLHPGEEVWVQGCIAVYLCSYFDEDVGAWKYVLKDQKDIFGGLFEVRDIKHIVHHKQQQEPMKGQESLWE